MNGQRRFGMCKHWVIIQPWERKKSCHLWQYEKTLGNYAKWNKSDTVRYHLHVESKTADLTGGVYNGGCQGLRGGENEGMVDQG